MIANYVSKNVLMSDERIWEPLRFGMLNTKEEEHWDMIFWRSYNF